MLTLLPNSADAPQWLLELAAAGKASMVSAALYVLGDTGSRWLLVAHGSSRTSDIFLDRPIEFYKIKCRFIIHYMYDFSFVTLFLRSTLLNHLFYYISFRS